VTSAIRLLVLLACLTVSPLSRAQRAELPAPESFKIADRWEWRQIDNRTKVEEARPTRTVVSIDGALHFSNGTTTSQIPSTMTDGTNKPSSKPWRVWPLEVGKKWSVSTDWIRPDGVTGTLKQDAEVVAFEEIVVPAGTFMAFKIEHKGWYQSSQGYRGKQNDTFWYSPEAKADAKHLRDDGYNLYTRELVSYRREAP
jgi:hypothetical protein